MSIIYDRNLVRFKTDLLKFIMIKIFNHYENYFKSGDIIFSGGVLYNELKLIEKNFINDIDISVNNNDNGKKILKDFNSLLNNIDLKYFKDQYNNDFKDNLLRFDELINIDLFISNHPNNYVKNIILFDNIYTHFFGYEWHLYRAFDFYIKTILNIDDPEDRENKKMKNMFIISKLLDNIDYSKINNINEINYIKKMINYDSQTFIVKIFE